MQWWNFRTDCMTSSLSWASVFQNQVTISKVDWVYRGIRLSLSSSEKFIKTLCNKTVIYIINSMWSKLRVCYVQESLASTSFFFGITQYTDLTVGWMTTEWRIIYWQGRDFFSLTSKLGQVKPHYHPRGTRIHSAGGENECYSIQ
jgi:hypothetical protein